MAYGFNKPKMKPCLGGMKHKWTFIKNTNSTRSFSGALGTSVHMSVKGLYKCNLCGHQKHGPMSPNEPQADLRDQLGAA